MRRCQLLYSIIICIICLLLSSCNSWFDFTSEKWDAEPSDTIFTVNRDHFEFSSNQSEEQLIIHSNVNWNISKEYGWCHVTPDLSGEGDRTLTVSCGNNTTSKDRNDTLLIKINTRIKRIPVFQSGSKYYIVPSTPRLEYEIAGGVQSFTVTSNTDWAPSLLHGGFGTLRQSGNELTLTVNRNTTAEERYDTILIASTNPEIQEQAFVYVHQKPLDPVVEIYPDSIPFGNKASTGSFSIESNLNWEVTCKCEEGDWCHITSNKTGTGNGTVTLSVDQNPLGAKDRNAVVTITTSAMTKIVKIHQAAGEEPIIRIIPETIESTGLRYGNIGGTQSFQVQSNIEWSVKSGDVSWCHIETPQGIGAGTKDISVTIDVNPAESNGRNCIITISSSLGKKEITVYQDPGDKGYVRVVKDGTETNKLSAKPQGETLTFDIESNLSSWTVSSNQNWCEVKTTSGSFNGKVELSVGQNSGSEVRDATITIKSKVSDVIVTVHQEPKAVPGGGDNPDPSYSRKR